MGMRVNVVVADAEDAGAIIESEKPVEEWKGFEANGLDQAKFAMLHALLSGELFDEALDECGPLYGASDEGPWLMKLPDDSVARLAELDREALARINDLPFDPSTRRTDAGAPVDGPCTPRVL